MSVHNSRFLKLRLKCNSINRYSYTVRPGFVGYRDHCDGEERIITMDFGSISDFETVLSSVKAIGGGDTCEDVHGGLEAILQLSWQSPNRCLIHIADAPAHGSRFHDGCNDAYKDYNDTGHTCARGKL